MKPIFTFFFLLANVFLQAQVTISGTVIGEKDKPVAGANVYLEGTYDGATTDANGIFSFETTATGSQMLVISSLTFDNLYQDITVEDYKPQTFSLKGNASTLNTVVINAGSFQAGDNTKVTALKPRT